MLSVNRSALTLLWLTPRRQKGPVSSSPGLWNRKIMELYQSTIHELQEKIKAGKTSASDIVASVFRRIEGVEGAIHAYITLMKEQAFEQAAHADAMIKRG